MADGRRYTWENDEAIAVCPPPLLALMPLTRAAQEARRAAEMAQKPRPGARERRSYDGGARAAGQASPERTKRYGAAALASIASELAMTPEGARNETLFKAACRLARLANGGCLDDYQAERELAHAAHAAGLTEREIAATIGSAFRAAGGECAGPPEEDPGVAAAYNLLAARRRARSDQRRGARR